MKMRKKFILLTTVLTAFSLAISTKATRVAFADDDAGYIVRNESVLAEDCFEITTNSPWVANAKWELSFAETAINKAYVVLDYDVTLSLNNPELVARLGINGTYFTGHDGENFHGSRNNIMKNWGDWFFLTPGRNQVYFPTDIFCSSVENMNKFGLYFDTGFDARAGSSINVYGLYLADTFDDALTTNYIAPKNYQDHTDLIETVGVRLELSVDKLMGEIAGAWLYGDYVGALKMHAKTASEGGHTVEQPDDFGYLTITLDQPVDVSEDDGFAFSVYGVEGETYFRIILEDDQGYFYQPAMVGGSKDSAGSYPMISDSIVASILHFYGCFYLNDKETGTAFFPYSALGGVNYMFGENRAINSDPISNIAKIHVGMDMLYGLGRNLVINEFGTCKASTDSVKSLVQLSKLSDTEWDRNNLANSTKLSINGSNTHKGNFAINAITENEVPGAKVAVDTTSIKNTVALAKTLK